MRTLSGGFDRIDIHNPKNVASLQAHIVDIFREVLGVDDEPVCQGKSRSWARGDVVTKANRSSATGQTIKTTCAIELTFHHLVPAEAVADAGQAEPDDIRPFHEGTHCQCTLLELQPDYRGPPGNREQAKAAAGCKLEADRSPEVAAESTLAVDHMLLHSSSRVYHTGHLQRQGALGVVASCLERATDHIAGLGAVAVELGWMFRLHGARGHRLLS